MKEPDLESLLAKAELLRPPKRDLWPGIEARIASSPAPTRGVSRATARFRAVPVLAAAAACVFVLGLAVFAGRFFAAGVQGGNYPTVLVDRPRSLLTGEIRKASRSYKKEKAELEKTMRSVSAFYKDGHGEETLRHIGRMDSLLAEMREVPLGDNLTALERDYTVLTAYTVHLDYIEGSRNLIHSILYDGEQGR